MTRLERNGPLLGFTVRLAPEYQAQQITAQVMIAADPKKQAALTRALQKMPRVRALHTISGQYDLIALVRENSTQELDACIDAIGALDGVERTISSIVLSTKFEPIEELRNAFEIANHRRSPLHNVCSHSR